MSFSLQQLSTKAISCILLVYTFSIPLKAQTQLLDSLQLEQTFTYTSIEEAMQHPEQVIRLELKKKKLKKIPPEVFQLTNLQYLDLSKNKLRELPDSIGKLTNLQSLILSKNEIEEINPAIGKLTNLFYLEINNNSLTALPYEIGKLENLRTLDLWSNDIGRFPDSMRHLKSLQTLDLRVIMIPDSEQARIRMWLPHTKIFFSPYCKCQQ